MARLTCKVGVQPPLVRLLCGIANVAAKEQNVREVVITSANDSVHQPQSLHYRDCAVDIRTRNFPDEASKQVFLAALVAELGDENYDFLYENPGTQNQHFHLEWDPRKH